MLGEYKVELTMTAINRQIPFQTYVLPLVDRVSPLPYLRSTLFFLVKHEKIVVFIYNEISN